MSEWISVEERLPERGELVQFWNAGRERWDYGNCYDVEDGWWGSTLSMERTRAVTHWMPLPPPPDEKQPAE
jgi:hypothetical protein